MSFATMLEILASEEKSLSELIARIPSYEMFKTKISCPHEKKISVMDHLAEEMKHHQEITRIDRTDGLKLFMKDGWVLMRPSGTEPIFRVYVEAKQKQKAQKLAEYYKHLVDSFIQGE